jgi:hypothetical protein
MHVMTFFLFTGLSLNVMAWNPFAGQAYEEVALTKAELQKVTINAGWAKEDAQNLIFEVNNGLKGPIQCGSATAELLDGKSLSKQFVPKFPIPSQSQRNASMVVLKGTLKSYALSCSCYKKKGSDLCVNPLKAS